jgi:hypothetical protein
MTGRGGRGSRLTVGGISRDDVFERVLFRNMP